MTQFDSQLTASRGSLVKRVTILAAAVTLVSVYAAQGLSRMVQNGDLAAILSEIELRRLAKTAPTAQRRKVTIIRSVGVDGTHTATIPHGFKAGAGFFFQGAEAK
jgi:hypothetical protein